MMKKIKGLVREIFKDEKSKHHVACAGARAHGYECVKTVAMLDKPDDGCECAPCSLVKQYVPKQYSQGFSVSKQMLPKHHIGCAGVHLCDKIVMPRVATDPGCYCLSCAAATVTQAQQSMQTPIHHLGCTCGLCSQVQSIPLSPYAQVSGCACPLCATVVMQQQQFYPAATTFLGSTMSFGPPYGNPYSPDLEEFGELKEAKASLEEQIEKLQSDLAELESSESADVVAMARELKKRGLTLRDFEIIEALKRDSSS